LGVKGISMMQALPDALRVKPALLGGPSMATKPIPREPELVYTILEWARLRKISKSTAQRLIDTGKVRVTYLSERRRVIRASDDAAYLDSCEVQS
jgi:hypothetical protein